MKSALKHHNNPNQEAHKKDLHPTKTSNTLIYGLGNVYRISFASYEILRKKEDRTGPITQGALLDFIFACYMIKDWMSNPLGKSIPE